MFKMETEQMAAMADHRQGGAKVRARNSSEINLSGVNAQQLKEWLAGIPALATLTVHTIPRDRPSDSEVTTITARWES